MSETPEEIAEWACRPGLTPPAYKDELAAKIRSAIDAEKSLPTPKSVSELVEAIAGYAELDDDDEFTGNLRVDLLAFLAAETERCAKVAEGIAKSLRAFEQTPEQAAKEQVARRIAAALREKQT